MGFDVPGIIKLLTQERPGAKLTMPIRRLAINHQARGELVRVIGRIAHDDPAGQRVCAGHVDLQRPRRGGVDYLVIVHTAIVARTVNEFLLERLDGGMISTGHAKFHIPRHEDRPEGRHCHRGPARSGSGNCPRRLVGAGTSLGPGRRSAASDAVPGDGLAATSATIIK